MLCTKENAARLDALYADCRVYHGEMHDHSNSGGRSDGAYTLSEWREQLAELDMDFAAILDHRQVRHMYLPEWEDGLFIAGTEPGTVITDSKAEFKEIHYNMILPSAAALEEMLRGLPEYEFTGTGLEGFFSYPFFTRARFCEIIDTVFAHGGFFVHPHPKQCMQCDDPLEYWFRDEMGMEVFYKGLESDDTKENYTLWCQLLAMGKCVWACAGGDWHNHAGNTSLTTIYAKEKNTRSFLEHLRVGDFTCGSVGVRMCVGETKTGGKCPLAGKTLTVCVSDFHSSVVFPDHTYRVDLLDDTGVVCSHPVTPDAPLYFTFPTADRAFYRAEVWDETRGYRIAIGNPIWNA